ncbi:MAG: hypothetical protein GYB54_18190, partial [Gammaproteobacteria bacterium]|nr:hypothetical protein [Gammaproteobacteria bacterium]
DSGGGLVGGTLDAVGGVTEKLTGDMGSSQDGSGDDASSNDGLVSSILGGVLGRK